MSKATEKLEPEDVIENQKAMISRQAQIIDNLEEELRIARSDQTELERAIVNHFVNDWRTGRPE